MEVIVNNIMILKRIQNLFWIMHPTGTYLGVLSKRENERMFIAHIVQHGCLTTIINLKKKFKKNFLLTFEKISMALSLRVINFRNSWWLFNFKVAVMMRWVLNFWHFKVKWCHYDHRMAPFLHKKNNES